jgi:hypothetical protein
MSFENSSRSIVVTKGITIFSLVIYQPLFHGRKPSFNGKTHHQSQTSFACQRSRYTVTVFLFASKDVKRGSPWAHLFHGPGQAG